jgi:exocyst complex protein 7
MNKAYAELRQTNLRSNQQAISDLTRLLKIGNVALETHFKEILQEDSKPEEPLRYVMKNQPFPTIKSDKSNRLGLINSYVINSANQNGASGVSPMIQAYADVRGPYLTATLANLALGSLNTAKKKNQDDIYIAETNGMGTYTKGMTGAFLAEFENICVLFTREEWGQAFNLTCQGAVSELARTLRELNSHIRANLNTDCFLAYEIIALMSTMSSDLESKTGELKTSFAAALKPVRETAKSSLTELLDDTRRRIASLPTIPTDGAAIPITQETMTRLQNMMNFLAPISSLMLSIGDSGWKSSTPQTAYSTDQAPTLNSFNISADGEQIFVNYCVDTIMALIESLDRKSQPLAKSRSVAGVFMLNNIAIIERSFKYSELKGLLENTPRIAEIDKWKKNGAKDYSSAWQDLSRQLMDVTYTNRADRNRPPSGSASTIDSAAIVKGLSSKDKEATKEKFKAFNLMFDDLVQKHKALTMEKEVKATLARDVQGMIEMLYHRFWDRYHEIDKGKGKYVKYDKAAVTSIFIGLST